MGSRSFLAFGVGLLLLGVLAVVVVRSVTTTIVSMLFFGWLLALASGIEVVQAVMVGHWAGFFHHLVAAVLFGVTGFLLVTPPVLSAEVATMLMAVFFLVSGLFQFIGSIWVALPGWGWQAEDGIVAILLGIARSCAMAYLRILGDRAFHWDRLIFYGAAWIALALGLASRLTLYRVGDSRAHIKWIEAIAAIARNGLEGPLQERRRDGNEAEAQ